MLDSTIRLGDAAGAGGAGRAVLRALRRGRHRPRGQDAGRGLRRGGGRRRSPARPGSASLAGIAFGGRAGDGARLRLHHPSRQPGGLGHGAQHHRGRARADAGRRVVPAGAARRPGHRRRARASRPIDLPFADALARACRSSGRSTREVISGHNILVYLAAAAGAAGRPGWSTAPASACACAPWARTRARSTPPASRSSGMRYQALMVDRRAVRRRRGLSVDRPERRLHPRHDRGQGLSGAGRPDLRQVAAGAGAAAPACCSPSPTRCRPGSRACRCPCVGVVPVQLIQALPYVLTILLLAGFVGKAVAPKAIGIPYVKER